MAFTPKSRSELKEQIRNIFLKGYIIRYNFIEDAELEVMDRQYINNLSMMGNIGQSWMPIVNSFKFSHNLFQEVKSELAKEYSVKAIRCEGSGCCQYTTYGAYIE